MLEWDEAKRRQTLIDRGVDFADAARLDWDTSLTLPDLRRAYDEPRFQTYGLIDGRLHVLIFTPRPDALRIISLRRANQRERRKWENR
jgi:uncharacterized DUF497 family protein